MDPIIITSQYGTLSRGKHSARLGSGSDVEWAGRDSAGRLVIDRPGKWQLHCTDGFSRVGRAVLTVAADGSYTLSGDARRFSVA